MDQALGVGGLQSQRDLPGDTERVCDGQGADPAQLLFEGFALEKLHRQEGDSAILVDLVDVDDVVVPDGRGGPGLQQEAAAELGQQEGFGARYLEGNFAAEGRVESQEDDGAAAAAQLPADLEASQLPNLGRVRREGKPEKTLPGGRDGSACRGGRLGPGLMPLQPAFLPGEWSRRPHGAP
jgi:hypothetical protein